MRADADFMVFVAARWPALVREAVLLGCPPEQAADATTDALARCRRGWGTASREENVDQLVRDELVSAVGRRIASVTTDAERQDAADELLVLAPPTLDDITHRESEHNRRILKRAAMVAVPLVLVAGGVGWWLASGDDPTSTKAPKKDLEQAAISRTENPAPGVFWYADGQLHLDHVVLAIEDVTDMTRLGTGVVYGDDTGQVVYVADDGSRQLLGHKDPAVPVAATDENGWATWVDTGGDRPELVVKEAATGNEVTRAQVDPASRVVSVDGNTIFYVDATGAHALQPGGKPAVRPVSPATLLDVRSRIQAFQLDSVTIQVVQSYFDVEFDLPGQGAALSLDGNLVATRLPGRDGEVGLYDTRSGHTLPNGLTDNDNVLALALGDRETITYIVAPNGLAPGRELQLRTCDVGARLGETTLCRIRAQIPNTGSTPVLAR